jgi:hypothetical protein
MGKSNAQRVAVWQVNLTWIWMLPRSRMEHTACFHVALFTLVWSSVKLYRERFGVEILLYKNRETIWFTNNQSYRFEKLIPHVDTYLMYMCVTVKSLSPSFVRWTPTSWRLASPLHCTERLLAGRSTPTEAAGCTGLQIPTPMLSWARVWPRPSGNMAGAMVIYGK